MGTPLLYTEAMRGAVQAYLPGTYESIVAGTGLSYEQVRARIREMRANGLAHVGDWKRATASINPVFFDGPGVDKKKPRALTGAEYARNYHKRNKKTEAGELRRAKQRANWHADQAKKRGDRTPIVRALFGSPP